MAKDPKKIAEKQVRRAQEAAGDYLDGVRNVSESPTQKAKRKKDKLKSNFNAAVDSGKWEAGLDSVSKEEWIRLTETKGGARYASGVESASADIEAFHAEFGPIRDKIKAQADAMPDSTLEQRLARMQFVAREMAKHRRTRRRR